MPGTAIFDLDRTITRKPTWTRFSFYANRHRLGFWLRVPAWMLQAVAYKLGFADRSAYKRYSLKLLSALGRDRLEAYAQSFAKRDVSVGLRPGAKAAIERHRQLGDRLVMATACCQFLARHYGDLLGFDDVIATEVIWDQGASPLLQLKGENCYGEEKLRRIGEESVQKSYQKPISAYSDHVSDLEMLCRADYGFAVNPSAALRKAAQNHLITVMNFET